MRFAIVGLSLLALVSFGPGCDGAVARVEPSTSAPADSTVWRALGTWSGRGDRQTESFDVVTGALRLRWQTRDGSPPAQGRFRVSLYSAISGRPLQTMVEQSGVGQGEAFMAEDPRIFFAVVDSADIDWTLAVDEGVTR